MEPAHIAALLGAAAALIACAKFWMDLGATKHTAKIAFDTAHEGHQRIDGLTKDLASFMSQAGREFATPGDIANVEKRLADAVEGMRNDFRNMTQRLDGFLNKHN